MTTSPPPHFQAETTVHIFIYNMLSPKLMPSFIIKLSNYRFSKNTYHSGVFCYRIPWNNILSSISDARGLV